MTNNQKLADELEKLCCAETEGKFFNCVTDNIQTIISALRAQPVPFAVEASQALAVAKRYAEFISDDMPPEVSGPSVSELGNALLTLAALSEASNADMKENNKL